MPINFLRHYYDIYKLLNQQRILDFIGTKEYQSHKEKRFRTADEEVISKNEAFLISDKAIRALYAKEFEKRSAIYFEEQPSFKEVINKIKKYFSQL